eukprot:659167-Rhodomonas_salina.2
MKRRLMPCTRFKSCEPRSWQRLRTIEIPASTVGYDSDLWDSCVDVASRGDPPINHLCMSATHRRCAREVCRYLAP